MNLASSAALQARSVYALVLRRIRSQYAGSRAGYAWAIVEPIVWVFVLKMAIKGQGSAQVPPLGTSFEVFFATGIVLARTWRQCVGQTSAILTRNKRERLPTLHRMDSVYAAWLLEMITGGVALIIILSILSVFGHEAMPYNMVMCLFAFVICAMFALASTLFLSFILTIAPGLNHFKGIFLLIVFMTSGFSFVVDRMPAQLRGAVSWNPLLHVVELFREGFYRGYECRTLDLVYLFSATVVCLIVGLTAERALRRHAGKDLVGGEEEEALI